MQTLILVGVLCSLFVLINSDAARCTDDNCTGACRCSGITTPIDPTTAPQLVALTFDEAVVDDVFTNIVQPLLFNRTNPDGAHISGTFFVPHEYTDYQRVQDLWVQGFEIGTNSITKNSSSEYWSTASVETLVEEFQGQRTIISTFAKIPIDDIIGARTPQLQLQGDVSIEAYSQSGVKYDNSWTTRSSQLLFPYTLNYLSTQECRLGTSCPTESHPGFWVLPIIDLEGNSTSDDVLECNALNGCFIAGTSNEIAAWLLDQVNRERNGNRAPLTILLTSAWFRITQNSFEAFQIFLDSLRGLNDVFLVSTKQIYEWIQNPVSLEEFRTDVYENRTSDCLNINCGLNNTDFQLRYMKSCISCPVAYPWLGNPEGEAA